VAGGAAAKEVGAANGSEDPKGAELKGSECDEEAAGAEGVDPKTSKACTAGPEALLEALLEAGAGAAPGTRS
jgi:uncharacterized protein YidB (DUF937 family)